MLTCPKCGIRFTEEESKTFNYCMNCGLLRAHPFQPQIFCGEEEVTEDRPTEIIMQMQALIEINNLILEKVKMNVSDADEVNTYCKVYRDNLEMIIALGEI